MGLINKPFGDIITFTRASAATRINADGQIETVAANVPRIDYDPVTLQRRGILIEEQRTNIISRSVDIGLAHNPGGAVLTPNFGAAPDGTMTSSRVVVGTGTFNFNHPSGSLEDVSGTAYCYSIFFKPKLFTGSITLYAGNGTSTGGAGFAINVASVGAAPVITGAGNGNGVGSVRGVGAGWWRLNFPYIATANNVQPTLTFATGWAAGTDVEFWGRQREIGGFPTSYIPTSGAQATRAADVFKTNTLAPWFSSAGSVVADFIPLANAGVSRFLARFGANGLLYMHSAEGRIASYDGVNLALTGASAITGGSNRAASAYSQSGSEKVVVLNGGAPGASSYNGNFGPPATGMDLFGGSFSGIVSKLRYFPKRLANSQLQALTA